MNDAEGTRLREFALLQAVAVSRELGFGISDILAAARDFYAFLDPVEESKNTARVRTVRYRNPADGPT